jgi:hypothetical protein
MEIHVPKAIMVDGAVYVDSHAKDIFKPYVCLYLSRSISFCNMHLPKGFWGLSVGNFIFAVVIFVPCFVEER